MYSFTLYIFNNNWMTDANKKDKRLTEKPDELMAAQLPAVVPAGVV